jgi:hypothetical protein
MHKLDCLPDLQARNYPIETGELIHINGNENHRELLDWQKVLLSDKAPKITSTGRLLYIERWPASANKVELAFVKNVMKSKHKFYVSMGDFFCGRL